MYAFFCNLAACDSQSFQPMSKRKTLVLVTDTFPQPTATEPSFVAPELDALKCSFERVIIVPTTTAGNGCAADLSGIEIEMGWATGADWKWRLRRARYLLLPSVWTDSRGDVSRGGLAFGVAARAFARFLKQMMRNRGLRWEDTLFYTFWFDFPTAALALLKTKIPEIKYVSRAHGHDMLTIRGGELRRKMLRQSERLFAASEAGAEYLREHFPAPGEGDKAIAETLGCYKLMPDAVAARHVRADRSLTFLSVARVDSNKRVALNARLLKALAVARPDTTIRWIHVGDGPAMTDVIAALDSKPANMTAEIRGAMTNEAVHRIYREEAIDWTMLLSEREGGRPVAVCESLAYGVPVVASDIPGLNEVVDDECGMLLPTDVTDEEFVRGIAPYLDSDFRSSAMREAALARWEERFDARKLRQTFVEQLSSIQ